MDAQITHNYMTNKGEGKDIRIVKASQTIHNGIERYMEVVMYKQRRRITKAAAAAELLDRATKKFQ